MATSLLRRQPTAALGAADVVVVLVCSDPRFAVGLQLQLEADEHVVLVAHEPLSALDLIRRERPDLVFIDASEGDAARSRILAGLDSDPEVGSIPVVTIRRDGAGGVPQVVYRMHVRG
ncbi:MAG: hypothetical protein ABI838_02340 [Chloroflexota bacterium]